MNNKALNREFQNNMLVEKKRFNAKSGFTDSEEEDESTRSSRSPGRSPGRQPLSGRSSLLSARSPRDDSKFNMQKRNTMNRPGGNDFRRRSPENRQFDDSEDESRSNTLSSPRKNANTRFGEPFSPKSPRVDPRMSDRSEGSLPRFNNISSNNNNRRSNLFKQDSNNDDERVTPRSSRSTSEKDDYNSMNMLSTMRHPMNESSLSKTMKRGDTPTKLNFTNKKSHSSSMPTHTQRRTQMGSRFDENINEEDSLSMSRSMSRERSTEQLYNGNSNFKKQYSVSPGRNDLVSPRFNQDREQQREQRAQLSPRETFDEEEHRKYKKQVEEHRKSPENQNLNQEPSPRYERREKDPEVTETVEDSRTAKKLQRQREEKRLEREKRAKTQTESTKRIENAIEMVENTMEDSMRLENLKEKNIELSYPSKPRLDETKVMLSDSRPRQVNRSQSARQTRTRSSSVSSTRPVRDKYAHVKPKTLTRVPPQTARTDADNSKLNDFMNDSLSIRENIYNEWYMKKLADAKANLRDAQLQKQNDEEDKAQDLINKLEKSQVEYKKWMHTKEALIQKQKERAAEIKKAAENEKLAKREQKQIASKAFDQWVAIKKEQTRETKQEIQHTEKITEKKKRVEKKNEKPPLPFEAWSKKKEEQINEKLSSEREKLREKKRKEKETAERKRLAHISYLEWLDKKELEEEQKATNLNRSMSNSMSAMPPFYPNSRTIPFGR